MALAENAAPDAAVVSQTAGGGALLSDLGRLFAEEPGLPVLVAEAPLTRVVRGLGMALERMDKFGSVFSYE